MSSHCIGAQTLTLGAQKTAITLDLGLQRKKNTSDPNHGCGGGIIYQKMYLVNFPSDKQPYYLITMVGA